MDIENVVIIGSGPSGMTAALYAARADRAPLVLAGFIKGGPAGGQLMTTTDIENFPGFPEGIQGPEIMKRMREQVIRFGARVTDVDVNKVDFSKSPFHIWTDEKEYLAKTVIISTGAGAKRLHTEAENRFWNRGVSACATCDGALPTFRNKPIFVVGGGDTAMEEALYLTRFGSSVTVVHRREEFKASAIMIDRAKANPKIKWMVPFALEDTKGGDLLEKVILKNLKTNEVREESASGLFMAIGHQPNTDLFKGILDLDEVGYIKTDGHTRTKIAGVFAAGDCVDHEYRQAITAAGQGCMAAIQSERYLQALGHH